MWPFKRTTEDDQTEALVAKVEELVRTKPDQLENFVIDGNGALLGFCVSFKKTNQHEITLMIERGGNLSVRVRFNDGKHSDSALTLSKRQKTRVQNAIDYLWKEKALRALDRKFD